MKKSIDRHTDVSIYSSQEKQPNNQRNKEREVHKMENIRKYNAIIEKARKKAENARATARELDDVARTIATTHNFRELKGNAELWDEYQKAGEDAKKYREIASLHENIIKSAENDCVRYVVNVFQAYLLENAETFDGMPYKYKKVADALERIAGKDFYICPEYSGMYYYIANRNFSHDKKETLYFGEDGYNVKTGKYNAYITADRLKSIKPLSIVGCENIEKNVKQAIKDAEKVKKMMEKFKADAGAIKSKYSNNSIYYIFEREVRF